MHEASIFVDEQFLLFCWCSELECDDDGADATDGVDGTSGADEVFEEESNAKGKRLISAFVTSLRSPPPG